MYHVHLAYETTEFITDQLPCWLTYTSRKHMKLLMKIFIYRQCILG